jgi:hypothetical protein
VIRHWPCQPTRPGQTRDLLSESTPHSRVGPPFSGVWGACSSPPDPASSSRPGPASDPPAESRSHDLMHPDCCLHTPARATDSPSMRRRLAPILSCPPATGMTDA